MASRVLITLGEDRTAKLDRLAEHAGQSRSALVREAVDRLLSAESETVERDRRLAALRAGFGAWKDRTDIGDAVEWQRRERAGWTRPWDEDYWRVRAEFPDLFDEEADREARSWQEHRREGGG
jgi:predicted transcriptional regulator